MFKLYLASGISIVVEQSTHNPMFKRLNHVAALNVREKKKFESILFLVCET
jgi:hypothetical protein